MSRITISLILAVASQSSVFAQPTGQDFLPLALGNSWCYNYYTYSSDLIMESSAADSGSANYFIISRLAHPDSTVWHFLERREGVTSTMWWASGNVRIEKTPFKDSTEFDLVEYQSGNHRVYRKAGGVALWKSVFYLSTQASDSSMFFRYHPARNEDTIGVVATWMDGALQLKLTFRHGIGITRVEYSDPKITGGHSTTFHTLRSQTVVGVAEPDITDQEHRIFELRPTYPNPFNPQTTISFVVREHTHVAVTIHDPLGRIVETIYNDVAQAGTHSFVWDASSVSSGIYFCVARTTHGSKCSKLVLVR
jgi:hypothetical protein